MANGRLERPVTIILDPDYQRLQVGKQKSEIGDLADWKTLVYSLTVRPGSFLHYVFVEGYRSQYSDGPYNQVDYQKLLEQTGLYNPQKPEESLIQIRGNGGPIYYDRRGYTTQEGSVTIRKRTHQPAKPVRLPEPASSLATGLPPIDLMLPAKNDYSSLAPIKLTERPAVELPLSDQDWILIIGRSLYTATRPFPERDADPFRFMLSPEQTVKILLETLDPQFKKTFVLNFLTKFNQINQRIRENLDRHQPLELGEAGYLQALQHCKANVAFYKKREWDVPELISQFFNPTKSTPQPLPIPAKPNIIA